MLLFIVYIFFLNSHSISPIICKWTLNDALLKQLPGNVQLPEYFCAFKHSEQSKVALEEVHCVADSWFFLETVAGRILGTQILSAEMILHSNLWWFGIWEPKRGGQTIWPPALTSLSNISHLVDFTTWTESGQTTSFKPVGKPKPCLIEPGLTSWIRKMFQEVKASNTSHSFYSRATHT